MIRLNKFLVFALVLFIGLGVACAAGVDDVGMDDATGSGLVNEVSSETSMDNGNLLVGDDVGDNTDPGANPTQYTSISETTYENAVITLSGDQSFTDGVATFGSNVTLKSDSVKRTLGNFKIVVSGNNVTINNVVFNHQTSTATKVIDVTSGASNVLINDTDILLSKNAAVTTMGISVSNANNVVVNSSNVDVSSASQGLVWNEDSTGNWYSTLAVSGVVVDGSSNVKIANGSVKITNTTNNLSGTTMPAITIRNGASNVEVYNNTINATGAQYNYGIMCNDYVSDLDIKYNRVNVTGEVYTAGMDVSTSTSSEVKYNNITVNSTNSSVIASGSEALSYGIILATYQVHNNNNVISYNNISLIANVGYGIENYMGSVNTIEYNNITIHAKRTIGIATNASNNNNYKYNNINLYCNNDDINYFYETIPAQNVGVIVIGAKNNNIQYNNITIYDASTNTDTYAIILGSDSLNNFVMNNILYVYNNNVLSKQGDNAVHDLGTNYVNNNLPNSITPNNQINNKNLKKDEETIIIDEGNISSYTTANGSLRISSGLYYIIDLTNTGIDSINILGKDSTIKIISKDNLYYIGAQSTVVNSYLPMTSINAYTVVNSTFYNTRNRIPSIENSVIYSMDDNYISYEPGNHTLFYSDAGLLLPTTASNIILRAKDAFNTTNNYNKPIIINKPVNILSYDNAPFNGDITFISGSEGSNITGLTLNGNLYINTSNINVKNTTINKGVFVNGGSGVVIEENTFNTDETAVVLSGAVETAIQNNNITTTSTYTITLDADSVENTITGNNLQAAELTGTASVLDNGEDNVISDGGDEPITVEPVLKVDTTEFTVGEAATITASIYKGDEVDSSINKGKVVFKVNGKTLKDSTGKVIYAKVTGGVATITDYEVPSSWAKDNVTIQAVYSGSSQCDALRAEANLTVTKDSPAITTSDVTASKGETVTLTATVAAGNTPVNVGKVVFKVNGKTVKDSNGKVIYASVVNGQVSVNYTVPENMKAGSYNITVTFTAPGYEKLTDTKTLTVSA